MITIHNTWLTLQIGVNDIAARVVEGEESKEPDKRLPAPDKDVDRMRDEILCKSLSGGYEANQTASNICQSSDIVMMTESPTTDFSLYPTRENIVRQLKRLVLHAMAGDKFFFYL